MLGNMSDVDALAKGMAVALINHFIRFTAGQRGLPAHGKQAESAARRGISMQTAGHGGVLAIQEGEKPKFIEEKLSTKLLPPAKEAGG